MKRKLFIHRFFTYFSILLVPIIFTLLFYSFITIKDLKRQGQVNTVSSLTSFNSILETALGNATYQSNLFTSAPRITLSLKKILSKNEMTYSEIVLFNNLQAILNSSVNSNLFIDSIYVSLDSYSRYLRSGVGIQNIAECCDQDWYTRYLDYNGIRKIWTCRRSFYEYGRVKEVITVYMRLSLAHGVFTVNLDINRLSNFFQQSSFLEKEHIILLNDKNELILSNEAKGLNFDLVDYLNEGKINLDSLEQLTPTRFILNNTEYFITLTSLNQYGLKTISIIAAKDYNTLGNYFKTTMLLLAICCIVLALFISTLITYKNIQQFNHLITVLSNAEKGIFHIENDKRYRLTDEYDLIFNEVIHTFITNDYLKTQIAEKQYKKQTAELIALQLQINPHFLFNTLQLLDLEAYQQTKVPTSLNTIIQELSTILKYALGDPQSIVTLREELEHLRAYVDINYRRYCNMFIVYYDYEEEILDYYLFRILLQPLIENSLYHGIRSLNGSRQGYIKLKIYERNDYLNFYIIDNGIGMDVEELQQLNELLKPSDITTEHIGLANTNRRLILNFGMDSALKIRSKKNYGTIISFRIPVMKTKDEWVVKGSDT